jgi:hypothetical protein
VPDDATTFPTREQIEARTDQIIDGIGYPHLPKLPGITFRRLTLAERGRANLARSRFLKDAMAEGGRFSRALLPTELRRRCLEVGIDYDDLMAQEEAFQKRIFDQAPVELRTARPRLTNEEVAALPKEASEAYFAQLQQAGQLLMKFINSLFTPEERLIRAQIEQVKQLRAQLELDTYDHHADVHERLTEILYGARTENGEPYFAGIDDLYELQDTDQSTWLSLCAKWREFKAGTWPVIKHRAS